METDHSSPSQQSNRLKFYDSDYPMLQPEQLFERREWRRFVLELY